MGYTESLKTHIEGSGAKLGRPILFHLAESVCKEDESKAVLRENAVEDGFICVLKTLKTYTATKVVKTIQVCFA